MNHDHTTPNKAIVFIVDDDPGMLRSLEAVMETQAVPAKTYSSAEKFLADYDPLQSGCLIADMRMPGMSGMQLLEHLRSVNNSIPVIIITGHGDIPLAVKSMKLGAVEFLQKPVDPRLLIAKARESLELDACRRAGAEGERIARERLSTLTNRESEVLDLLVSGLSNKQIAIEMGISIKTVEHHRAHIMAKTAAVNGADLVRMKMLTGIGGIG